jgi:hypothetical protein
VTKNEGENTVKILPSKDDGLTAVIKAALSMTENVSPEADLAHWV